ncbi:tyrosine-type recombinase/integrase [Arthrobacter rhombi]|uniref:tyrosine-type recombinase/integrase n=1 Tax=Arthrobacter rhombi TaxID=71253 RepID=UPI003FD5CF20
MAVRKRPNGKWQADYYGPDGKRHMPSFPTQREAKAFLLEVEAQKKGGTYVDPALSKATTFDHLWRLWVERVRTKGARGNRPASAKTLEDYQFNYEHYLRQSWQYRPLSFITRREVEAWADGLVTPSGAEASDYGRSRAVAHLTRALDYAVAQGLMPSNPARDRAGRGVSVPEVQSQRAQVRLTLPQLVRLAQCMGEYRLLVLFTGLTGLRWGEVSTLRRKHFEFGQDATVAVERAYSKTREQRVVPIPASVAGMVARVLEEAGAEALAFPSPSGVALDSKNFANRTYKPAGRLAGGAVAALQAALRVEDTRRRVQVGESFELVAEYGAATEHAVRALQVERGLPATGTVARAEWEVLEVPELHAVTLTPGDVDFMPPTFHNLRHTAVSLAISAGANVKLVQRIAGHKSATMTLDVYGDLFDDDLQDSARRLDARLQDVPGFAVLADSD